jgi:hypothetical protein
MQTTNKEVVFMYANNTSVSVEKSQQEVQSILRKYGASKFGTMEDHHKAYIMFGYNNLMIQISVDLPKRDESIKTPTGRKRKESQADIAYEQNVKQRWRSLVLLVKAKLVAVSEGLTTIEKEFLGDIILPDGKTISMKIAPQIKKLSESGEMPKLLGNI